MLRVMIVDDSEIARKMVKKHMSKLNCTVATEACTAQEAIDKYVEYEPDFVTLDVTMPGGNGLLALTKIINRDKEAKVIMVTSHGEEDLIMDAIDIGAIGYVLKPITLEKLKQQMTKIV